MNLLWPKLTLLLSFWAYFEFQTHVQLVIRTFQMSLICKSSFLSHYSDFLPQKLTGSRTILLKLTGFVKHIKLILEGPCKALIPNGASNIPRITLQSTGSFKYWWEDALCCLILPLAWNRKLLVWYRWGSQCTDEREASFILAAAQ